MPGASMGVNGSKVKVKEPILDELNVKVVGDHTTWALEAVALILPVTEAL